MIRTFIDSGVLIAAALGTNEVAIKAMEILDDPNRGFISSNFVRLETLPKAYYQQNKAEVEFYEEFFQAVLEMVNISERLVDRAFAEARLSGLSAVDALHLAAAKIADSDELITSEKPTKPIFAAKGIKVSTIQPRAETGT